MGILDFFRWGAIAYSKTTEDCGWVSRAIGEQAAMQEARSKLRGVHDGKVVGTCCGSTWMALAVGDDGSWAVGYSHAPFANRISAESTALQRLTNYQVSGGNLIVCSISGLEAGTVYGG